MHRFLVISYDDDQQQVFFDFALAPDANRAKQTIQVLRPYAVAIDAFEPKELTQMATGLATCTDEEIVRVLSEIQHEEYGTVEDFEQNERGRYEDALAENEFDKDFDWSDYKSLVKLCS